MITVLKTGLHDLITMECVGFDRDGDAMLILKQRGIHDPQVHDQVCFVFKGLAQMAQLRDWLSEKIAETQEDFKEPLSDDDAAEIDENWKKATWLEKLRWYNTMALRPAGILGRGMIDELLGIANHFAALAQQGVKMEAGTMPQPTPSAPKQEHPMPRDINQDCLLEAIENSIAAKQIGDADGAAKAAAEFRKYLRQAIRECAAEQGELAKELARALGEVVGCFEAANVEGLAEKLAGADIHDTGSLADLVHRRLLCAVPVAQGALDKAKAAGLV